MRNTTRPATMNTSGMSETRSNREKGRRSTASVVADGDENRPRRRSQDRDFETRFRDSGLLCAAGLIRDPKKRRLP